MEPILALAAIKSVTGIISDMMAPAPPKAPHYTKAPVARGPFAKSTGRSGHFGNVLSAEVTKNTPGVLPLQFSFEAYEKMEMMGIRLDQSQYDKLMEGMREAAANGSQKPLIMMDGLAFVVDAKQGKILDVSHRNRLDTKAYTQIDSVIETKI